LVVFLAADAGRIGLPLSSKHEYELSIVPGTAQPSTDSFNSYNSWGRLGWLTILAAGSCCSLLKPPGLNPLNIICMLECRPSRECGLLICYISQVQLCLIWSDPIW
jgi:hypothetical protein